MHVDRALILKNAVKVKVYGVNKVANRICFDHHRYRRVERSAVNSDQISNLKLTWSNDVTAVDRKRENRAAGAVQLHRGVSDDDEIGGSRNTRIPARVLPRRKVVPIPA